MQMVEYKRTNSNRRKEISFNSLYIPNLTEKDTFCRIYKQSKIISLHFIRQFVYLKVHSPYLTEEKMHLVKEIRSEWATWLSKNN